MLKQNLAKYQLLILCIILSDASRFTKDLGIKISDISDFNDSPISFLVFQIVELKSIKSSVIDNNDSLS